MENNPGRNPSQIDFEKSCAVFSASLFLASFKRCIVNNNKHF